jgi:hypothetical protein
VNSPHTTRNTEKRAGEEHPPIPVFRILGSRCSWLRACRRFLTTDFPDFTDAPRAFGVVRATGEICCHLPLVEVGRAVPARSCVFHQRQSFLSGEICKLLVTKCFPPAGFRIQYIFEGTARICTIPAQTARPAKHVVQPSFFASVRSWGRPVASLFRTSRSLLITQTGKPSSLVSRRVSQASANETAVTEVRMSIR